LGRLTNTLAVTKLDTELDTATHAWSLTDTNPPSNHTLVTGWFVTRLVTSVEVLFVRWHANIEGKILGSVVGMDVGFVVGVVLGD
jgi:hypothetical protein